MGAVRWQASAYVALLTVGLGGRVEAAPNKSASPAALHRADVEADLVSLANSLKDRWAYAEARQLDGINIDALVFDAFSGTAPAVSRSDFISKLERFVAALHDGHAAVFDPPGLYPSTLWPRRCPIDFASSSEGVVAARSTSGIERGDLIESIDGVPTEKLIVDLMARTPASTATARRYWATRALGATDAPSTKLVVVDNHGTRREVTCAPEVRGVGVGRGDWIEWRVLDGNIGYLRVSSFFPHSKAGLELLDWMHEVQRGTLSAEEYRGRLNAPFLGEIRTAFASLEPTSALILDLRGNVGGTDVLGMEVASHLVSASYTYYFLSGRQGNGKWTQPAPVPVAAEPPTYTRPLAVLIDEGTFSAADNLAAFIRDERPATFVGRPTGGGTGAPRDIILPRSGAHVVFCTMRVFSPRRRMIEGTGTTPDIAVHWSRADYTSGRDADLEAAVRVLRQRRPRENATQH